MFSGKGASSLLSATSPAARLCDGMSLGHFLCDGSIGAEMPSRDFSATSAAFRTTSSPGASMHFSSNNEKTHFKRPGRERGGYSCWTGLPEVLICAEQRMLENVGTRRPYIVGDVFVGRMGPGKIPPESLHDLVSTMTGRL
ncbi:hypothetical protein GOODEAATRI_012421 [Goodea atripinnis]|uniref:Uncharacterized protein n=1 Tax=Goodea atripinnis TaxID=208336 RepID=A0ABV0P3S8_9TELE